MANKHMKRCSILLVTGKYKITMRKHYTSMKWQNTYKEQNFKITISSACEDAEQLELSCIAGGNPN